MKSCRVYPPDLSDQEWAVLESLLPTQHTGRPRKYSHRQMLSALFYHMRSGGTWRVLPPDLPPWPAVYAYYRKLEREGLWPRLNDALAGLTGCAFAAHPPRRRR